MSNLWCLKKVLASIHHKDNEFGENNTYIVVVPVKVRHIYINYVIMFCLCFSHVSLSQMYLINKRAFIQLLPSVNCLFKIHIISQLTVDIFVS